MVTQARLHEILSYDPETGIFTWKCRVSRTAAGSVAGTVRANGYLRIKFDRSLFYAHRLAWLYVYGTVPIGYIDHIDGNPGNNAISNLRDVSQLINAQNIRRPKSHNKSTGVLGVNKNGSKFRAKICVNGLHKHLGCFLTPEEAHEAYLKAKRLLHVGCAI